MARPARSSPDSPSPKGCPPLPRGTALPPKTRRKFAKHDPGDGRTSPPILLSHDLEGPLSSHEGRAFKIMEVSGRGLQSNSENVGSEIIRKPTCGGYCERDRFTARHR